jgi:hypothetical protein
MRDLQESTLAAQQSSLQQGYNAAAQQRQADLTRQLSASQQIGALGGLSQSLGLNNAAALEAIGTTQQTQDQRNLDLAYSDFAGQRDYDRNQIAFLNSAIRGLEIPTSTSTSSTQTGMSYTPSGLAQLGQVGATIYGFGKMGSNDRR